MGSGFRFDTTTKNFGRSFSLKIGSAGVMIKVEDSFLDEMPSDPS